MQKVILAGNVGNVRTNTVNGQNGSTFVLNFSLAVKSDKKGQDGKYLTDWWECSVWGKYAEVMSQYIVKGSSLAVEGKPGAEIYTNNQQQSQIKQTCLVKELTLMGGGQQAQQQPAQAAGGYAQAPQPARRQSMQPQSPQTAPAYGEFDDECPF